MLLPENHERIRIISDVVGESLARHVDDGGHYYDETSAHLAARAIHDIMPGLMEMQKSRVIIESEIGVAVDSSRHSETLDGMRVEAQFERVSIQGLISTLGNGEDALTMTSYDLCAVLKPQYVDPDPMEIVFGEELYIPFKNIQLFEAVR